MEAAHAALALADPANTGVVPDPWVASPQMPFNYAWGRAAATAQTAVAAAASDAASINETLEAARRGRGRPKKDPTESAGAEAGAKGSADNASKKPPPIRGRGRPPRTAEPGDPAAPASLYDKFPLPPGLQSSGWPPPPPTSGHVGVNLTRETSGASPRSGGAGSAPYGDGHAVPSNACCPPGASASSMPAPAGNEHTHHHQHHPHQHQHHPPSSVDNKDSGSSSTAAHQGENSASKLHPTYPPFSAHTPGPTCFPGKQMYMINSPVSSPPPPTEGGPPVFKQSPSSQGGGGSGGGSQHHHKSNSNKQPSSSSSAANSSNENSALAVVPRPIMLGGTNVGCPICFKIFGSKGLLSQHMLVHTDVRKHACLYCDKSFKQQSHLKAHVRIHTGADSGWLGLRLF